MFFDGLALVQIKQAIKQFTILNSENTFMHHAIFIVSILQQCFVYK